MVYTYVGTTRGRLYVDDTSKNAHTKCEINEHKYRCEQGFSPEIVIHMCWL